MTKFAIIFFVWVFLLLASGGGLTRAGYEPVKTNTNTYECFNYELVSNKMFELQSKWIYSKGLKRKVIERKINKLRPSLINREVLCLGNGVTPN